MEDQLLQTTITLGDLLGISGTVVAVVTAYIALSTRLTTIEVKVGPLWAAYCAHVNREKRGRSDDAEV